MQHFPRKAGPVSATDILKAECNRYVNGHCSTARCVKRGMAATGMTFPLTDYAVSTCEHHEAVCEIERLCDLVKTLVENDPMDPISDGGHVVLDLWRHDARKALGLPEQSST